LATFPIINANFSNLIKIVKIIVDKNTQNRYSDPNYACKGEEK